MNQVEIKQHLETIIDNIASIMSLTRQITFEDFRQNERMRKNVYEYLQGIGQAANKLVNSSPELTRSFAMDTLASFRNARYNSDAEIQHQNVWNLVELDLPVIREEIEQSDWFMEEELDKNPEEKVKD